ncbi:50S ribosomal protein L20 [candidate division CSSED10-310 bacterium]|uniref:Large ribosomal subunit protein bL20 n=1 Tax=candidate division CSSED10-310 bacterium TaxID=2855610 RepID=A0ABV6YTP0_UNCC1
MTRVKRGTRGVARRKKVLKSAKGFRGARKKLFRTAREAVDKALQHSYRDRRNRKRDFRRLWIARINAATRNHGLVYSRFIEGLHKAGVKIDRKILADLAIREPETFTELVQTAKTSLAANN